MDALALGYALGTLTRWNASMPKKTDKAHNPVRSKKIEICQIRAAGARIFLSDDYLPRT